MTMEKISLNQRLAAIDIGSNSFHMVIAELCDGGLKPLDLRGKKVQLGAGMKHGLLADDAIVRGLSCLRGFADVLQEWSVDAVKVVATNALRIASNRQLFTEAAEQLLGCTIHIINGEEEARLVYLGVQQGQVGSRAGRLVIDIGGGSTELITGRGASIRSAESLQLGCVSFLRYFPDDKINEDCFNHAYQVAVDQLQATRQRINNQWQECIGSSGTLLAIEQVMIQLGLSEGGIHRQGLLGLKEKLLAFHNFDEVSFQGLRESRKDVFASGLAITLALFDVLDIETMTLSDAALREGVLIDMLADEVVLEAQSF